MSSSPLLVAALYKFVAVEDPESFASWLRERAAARGVRGTLLVASEGLNGTICGEAEALREFLKELREDPRFTDIEHKESWCDDVPLAKLKVQVKAEICTLREPVDPTQYVGEYVPPEQWNALVDDPNVMMIDVRNDMEVALGSFEGAVDPHTVSFAEWPEYVEKNLAEDKNRPIAMFCTGGIRCEKATSLMVKQGFKHVYHLKGGILAYLAQVPKEQSRFRGSCFVFDERIAVDHDLKPVDPDQLKDAPKRALPPSMWRGR